MDDCFLVQLTRLMIALNYSFYWDIAKFGKAVVFGTIIKGSSPFVPTKVFMV
jgi:hypothetical protein